MQQQINFNQHPNSIYAWGNDVQPNLPNRQMEVIKALRYLGEATCSEVATYLKTFPHTLSGRFSELRRKGLIEEVGNRIINGRPHAICKATI